MIRPLMTAWRVLTLAMVLTLGISTVANTFSPGVALAQSDLSVEPKAVTPAANELRGGFQFVPEKSEQREPVPGIVVYEADFVRDQTPKNFADGPIEIKTLVAKTANAQQAAEQFTSSRQALTTASPPWAESKVAKLGDEAAGLTMEGQSADGQPAVAHLFLFRRGAMVVGITVAGLTKPTRMAEAESIAAIVLRKIDPGYKSQTAPSAPRNLNTQRPGPTVSSGAGTSGSTQPMNATTNSGGQKVRVANTGGTGVRLRAEPSLKGAIAARLADGTVLEIVGEDRKADGLTWRNVRAPGDGRGWVAADYLVSVSGGSTPPAQASAPAPAAPPAQASASAAPAPSTTTAQSQPTTGTSSNASSGAAASGDFLKVDVSVKQSKIKGDEQTVSITVTKNGQPVQGATVTVKTSPTGETPEAPATDGSGKSSVSWKPTGSPGFIGVGVSALAPDGSAGVGGASFEIVKP
ncbi:MAG: SH3 domain-containing protein [Chloroflexi bacterium]|nr:SH3 domain-containing protein [Chloroflexota bacterium]